ncbi:hypothetical protein ACJIZ3_012683 [Penstemon smallii]|uniref:Uncharacterized protein n=1 Tax=Penstemon smallii TaxID=265156 RepID=A0ABD3UPV7_9LAMI
MRKLVAERLPEISPNVTQFRKLILQDATSITTRALPKSIDRLLLVIICNLLLGKLRGSLNTYSIKFIMVNIFTTILRDFQGASHWLHIVPWGIRKLVNYSKVNMGIQTENGKFIFS